MHLDPGMTNAVEIGVFATVGLFILRELQRLVYALESYASAVARLSRLSAPPSAGVPVGTPVQELASGTGERREATFHFPASMMPWATPTDEEE